jgi:hypothetical protein
MNDERLIWNLAIVRTTRGLVIEHEDQCVLKRFRGKMGPEGVKLVPRAELCLLGVKLSRKGKVIP